MNRRDALKQFVVGGTSLLVLNEALTKLVRAGAQSGATLNINIDDPRFAALKNVNGSVLITDAEAPGIQAGLLSRYPLALVRVDQTGVSALETYCMHQGCQVNPYDGTKFQCPCHGSQYTATGAVKRGPTTAPLKSYPAVLAGSIVTVSNLPGNMSWNLTSADSPAGTAAFELRQNYPNPFGAGSRAGTEITRITFVVADRAHVTLTVHDAAGNLVGLAADGLFDPGIQSVDFNAAHLPAGVYFYTLRSGGYTESRKMEILK